MVTASAARNIVGIIGNVISFFLFASPIPTFVRISKRRSMEEFKPDPYLATIMNCSLWVLYGLPFVTPDSILVITINGIGLLMEIAYITIFFSFAQKRNREKLILWIMIGFIMLGTIASCTMLMFHTHATRSKFIGILCVIFGVLMYASPLTVMRKVVRIKSVKYMPFFLSLTNFINGVVWVAYALIRFDLYILIGNGFGAIFGAIQLILYGCYCSSAPNDEENTKPNEVQLSGCNVEAWPVAQLHVV